jgi:opacity protein-like surface antigen
MRRISMCVVSLLCAMSLAAVAQENRSDISLQGTGFFTKSSSGNGTSYSTTETGGFLVGYHYHLRRWLSAEIVYGYNRDTQKFALSSSAFRIQSNIHQATGGFVANLPSFAKARLSPYVLAAGGALVFAPISNQFNTVSGAQTQAKAVFVYGGGVNYGLGKRVSLRVEYRGLVYGSPDFGFGGLNTNSLTHTAQPSVGLAFRF